MGMVWHGYGRYCPAPGHISLPGTKSNTMVPGGQYLGSLVPSPVPCCCLSLALPMQPALQGPAGFDLKQDLVPHNHWPCPRATRVLLGTSSNHSSAGCRMPSLQPWFLGRVCPCWVGGLRLHLQHGAKTELPPPWSTGTQSCAYKTW